MSKVIKKQPFKKLKTLKKQITPYSIVVGTILLVYVLSLLVVLLWGGMTSLKTRNDFLDNLKIAFPKILNFENFSNALMKFSVEIEVGGGIGKVYLYEMFLNSLLYSIGCAFTATLIPCIAGYMTAKFNYKFSKIMTGVVIITMIIPIVGSLPSEIRVAQRFGLYDNIWGLWIMRANFLGMYFLIFQKVFKNIPDDYTEAAQLDGASYFSVFLKIMLPLVKNTFLTVMLLKFVEHWNDYSTPLVYLPSQPTAAVGLFYFSRSTDPTIASVPMKMAGAMLLLLPILIIYIFLQDKLMGNISLGGIKG